jgi:hypothetical protein
MYILYGAQKYLANFIMNLTFLPLKCDFYIKNFNLVIEYNGRQHYEPIKLWGGEPNNSRKLRN